MPTLGKASAEARKLLIKKTYQHHALHLQGFITMKAKILPRLVLAALPTLC